MLTVRGAMAMKSEPIAIQVLLSHAERRSLERGEAVRVRVNLELVLQAEAPSSPPKP